MPFPLNVESYLRRNPNTLRRKLTDGKLFGGYFWGVTCLVPMCGASVSFKVHVNVVFLEFPRAVGNQADPGEKEE